MRTRQATRVATIAEATVAAWFMACASHAAVIYVDIDAPDGGDGMTWETAFNDLHDGLDAAADGDQLWIAEGTYKPAGENGNQTIWFHLVGGVELYGGFEGDETELDQRDWVAHLTVLSGDLNDNDDEGFFSDNSAHVLEARNLDGSVTLDGLTITGGSADPTLPEGERRGGGLIAENIDLCIANCTFTAHYAREQGGIISLVDGSITVTNSRFENGRSGLRGGAIDLVAGSAVISHSQFEGNDAEYSSEETGGGAIALIDTEAIISDSEFMNNEASRYAGSILIDGADATVESCRFNLWHYSVWFAGGAIAIRDSDSIIAWCTFEGTHSVDGAVNAYRGGAIHVDSGHPIIRDCTFVGVAAEYRGGAVDSWPGSGVTIERCVFVENAVDGDSLDLDSAGGAVHLHETEGLIRSCGFISNSASSESDSWAGAVYLRGSDVEVIACTFRDNSTQDSGGGMYLAGGLPIIRRCLFGHNDAAGGAALACHATAIVEECDFSRNTATAGGAVVLWYPAFPAFINCRFHENHATASGGGAVFCSLDARAEFVDCLFTANVAELGLGGAVMCAFDSDPDFVNCTIVRNAAALPGGGLAAGGFSDDWAGFATLHDCIVWNNTSDEATGEAAQIFTVDDGASAIFIDYSCVQDWTGALGGEGNMGADPIFVNPDNDDFRIGAGSPCIDAADNTAVPEDIEFDLARLPRFVDDPDTPDTGFGTPPIVDMGAYEYQALDCAADLNDDGIVDVADLLILLAAWGEPGGEADIIQDGLVDHLDLFALLAGWGPCP
jgi:hypothetical protein